MSLFEGQNLKGRAINIELGLNGDHMRARWDMEIVEGEHKGKIAKYSGKLNPDTAKWTKRDMKAIGWKGVKSSTFVADVKAANLVVEFEAQIARHNGSEWVAAKFYGAAPLAPLDSDKERELDRMLAEADDGGGQQDERIPF